MRCEDDTLCDLPWLKRRLRRLKSQEAAIRFDGKMPADPTALVWNRYFCLGSQCDQAIRYGLSTLAAMTRAGFNAVVADFFTQVYYQYCLERGLLEAGVHDPTYLADLGLAPSATDQEIKSRFRQLVHRHHPDAGGNSAELIKVLKAYRKLTEDRGHQ